MSIRKIAEMTGLSVATVSHVINGTRGVSEKSRALVLAAIDEIGYRPNRAARMLKTQKSNTVALVIPSVKPGRSTNFFFMNVLSGAKDVLETHGYDLIVSTYTEGGADDEKAEIAVMQKLWVDGMLLVPGDRQSKAVELAALGDLPFVLVDRTVDNADCACVYSDNYTATRRAVELFYQSGKRRIGFIGGMISYSTGFDRFRAYQDALLELGLPCDESIIRHDVEYTPGAACAAAKSICEQQVDAIFTSNNVLTIGVLQYLGGLGIKIPQEIGVIGYEDYEWMEIFSPPVTTIRQQSYAMGAVAAEMLLEQLAGAPSTKKQLLEAPLIIRGSHG